MFISRYGLMHGCCVRLKQYFRFFPNRTTVYRDFEANYRTKVNTVPNKLEVKSHSAHPCRVVNIANTIVSAILSAILFRYRHVYRQYVAVVVSILVSPILFQAKYSNTFHQYFFSVNIDAPTEVNVYLHTELNFFFILIFSLRWYYNVWWIMDRTSCLQLTYLVT